MRALLIGTTMLEELGIPEYKHSLEGLLKILGVEIGYPDLSIEQKALLLYAIGSRYLASEGLSEIAKQALDYDYVLYVSPCIRVAFKELRFMTPVTELTVHEFVLPKVNLKLEGKALLACNRKQVRPEIKTVLASYGLELEENCVFPFLKISSPNDYVRIRRYIAEKYRDYVLTCPLQKASFKDENVEAREILEIAYEFLQNSGSDDRRDEYRDAYEEDF